MNIIFDFEYLDLHPEISLGFKNDLEKIRTHFINRIKPLQNEINTYSNHSIVFNLFGNIKYTEGIKPPMLICYDLPFELADKINECINENDTNYLHCILNLPLPPNG